MMIAVGRAGVPHPVGWIDTAAVAGVMLFILSMVGMGLMLSAICATQQQAILGSFAVGYPMIMMSGFATPVENMPIGCRSSRRRVR